MHRHGDRSPVSTYPTDPYADYPWPGGLGALSQKGTRQLFDMGTHIRPRYESLKPWDGIYTAETVHAISSSPERTRMSGASLLAAFWEPYECQNSLPIPWQPVPLEVIPAKDDYVRSATQRFPYLVVLNTSSTDSLSSRIEMPEVRPNLQRIFNKSRSPVNAVPIQ